MRRACRELETIHPDLVHLGSILHFLKLGIKMLDGMPRLMMSSTKRAYDVDSKICALLCPSAAHTLKAVELVWEEMDIEE